MLAQELFPAYYDGNKIEIDTYLDYQGIQAIEEINNKIALLNIERSFCFISNAWRVAFEYYLSCFFLVEKPLHNNVVGYTINHQIINCWFTAINIVLDSDNIFNGIINLIEASNHLITPIITQHIEREVILKFLIQISLFALKNGGFNEAEQVDKYVNVILDSLKALFNVSFPDYETTLNKVKFLMEQFNFFISYDNNAN